jgi:ABC-2 type transport system permease protein
MAESNWFRNGFRIGIFEFRRSVRAIWQDKARAFLMAIGLVLPSLMLTGFIYLFAEVIRTAGTVSLPPMARGTVALFWLFGVFIVTQRVVSARPRIDAEPLMLTTVSARTVVGGLVIAETLRGLAYLGLPVIVLAGGVVYLFGISVAAILIPFAAVLLGLTTVLVGMGFGYAIALLIATSPFVARHKTVLGTAAVFVAMGAYLLATLPQFGGVDQAALAVLPVGWFVDLAVIGSPVQGSMTRAAVVIGESLLILVLGMVLIEWEATQLWFTDPVSVESDTESPESPSLGSGKIRTALAEAIAPVGFPTGISQPTRTVAQWSVLRTRREPRRLNFLLAPIVMVGSVVFSSGLQAPSHWVIFAPVAAVFLPWMAGAVFAMNPFGDEGAVLPVTLISISAPAYVRGLVLPGVIFGLPLAVIVTGGAALAGPFAPSVAIGLVGVSLLATVVAVTTAPAVGLWFPRFSAVSIGQSREIVPPRLFTTAVHFVSITVPGTFLSVLLLEPKLGRTFVAGSFGYLPGLLLTWVASGDSGVLSNTATWFGRVGKAVESLDVQSFRLIAGSLLVLGAIIVAGVSYRLAVRRFNRYSPQT